jgi:hypothetical protein
MPEAVVAKARGRTGIESDSDLIQTALANLALPDHFPDWVLSQNSMADAQRGGFLLPSATRSVRTDSVFTGYNISFSMTPSAKRFTPIRRSRASPASRVACCKAASSYLYRAIKSNIGDSLHVVIQIERRPGRRYISEVLEINSYDADGDPFDYCAIYQRQEPSQ